MINELHIKKAIRFVIAMSTLLMLVTSDSIAEVNDAYQHIYEVMDRYHQTFNVYTNLSAAGNHFVAYGKMTNTGDEDKVTCESTTYLTHSGDTCIVNRFIANGNNWGGWYFMSGVLEGEETQPKLNWGDYPDAGVDLTGATQLTFWARGENGGEQVEFFAFGVGREYHAGLYPDSSNKVSLGYITLSTSWTQYTIDLSGHDLSYVLGGFGWVTNAPNNNNQDVTFYLDEIKYNKSRLNEPRFLVSYETISSPSDFDTVLDNVAFTYDNALVLLALLARGTAEDTNRAKLIADAFVFAINHDRYFNDGRLRNTYQGGDLVLPQGWKPNGREDTVRMTGWWDMSQNIWYEDKGFVGSSTGNLAWAMIALLSYYEQVNDSNYLDAAKALGEWIEANTKDLNGAGGYTGGYEGWEPTVNHPEGQTKFGWKSTEHNIDVYAAFMRLYEITGESKWSVGALHAKTFIEAMWDTTESHFWTGTLDDGITINKSNIPLDIQAWALMAMKLYNSALGWAENNCYTETDGFKGFDFNNDKDGIWFEGTAQMAVAYQVAGQSDKSDFYISELRKAQELATNTNGKGIVSASHDGVTTGFDWEYFSRLHIGATAWYIFAEMEYNPYWGTKIIPEPIDYVLTVKSSGASAVSIDSSTGHNATTDYTKTVMNGTSVNLQAPQNVTSGGSIMCFTSWTGSMNSSNPSITFSMDANKTVTANYTTDTHLLLYDSLDSSESIAANAGTASGVTFTSGISGNAAYINGYIDYPYAGRFEPSAGTIQFLVKPSDAGSMGIIEVGRLGYANSLGIFRITSWGRTITALEVRKNDSSYLQAWHDVDKVRLENGRWNLVTAIWQCNSGANDFFQLYLNDVPGYRHSGSVCTDLAEPSTKHIRLGNTYWYGDGVGEYDELKIFDYAKSESEIRLDYQLYFKTGGLQVTLGPAGAVSAGAQWNVDGGAWQNSGTTVTDLSVGSHTVNYKAITGWDAPLSEQVTVNNGQTTSISRNYTQQPGNLQVALGPAGAVSAGAQWSVDGGAWQNSGDTITGLAAGSHTVSYKAITGWNAPASEQVTVNNGQTTSISRNYTQQPGNLQVTLGPAEAVLAGAQWRVDGGAWKNSGDTVTGLTAGSHTVNYRAITAWNAPVSEQVAVNNGQTTTIERNYTRQPGNLRVWLWPWDAVSAGAQWNVDSGAWQNSGDTITGLSAGLHTIIYKPITDWIEPSSEQVTINSGLTTYISRNYGQLYKFGSFDGQKNVELTLYDCNNNVVTFNLAGGGCGEINNQDCAFSNIVLYDTTEKSILTIKTKGNVGTHVGDIICQGSLKGISAKTIDITGSIEVGASLNPKAGVTIVFDEASDLEINSRMPIKSITATEWVGGSINALSIGSITTKGDLDVDVAIDSNINSVKVAGELSGDWTCNSVKSISAMDVVETNLILSQQPDADVQVFALGKLTVKGWIDSSQILSKGNIGTVTTGAIIDSSCFAGVEEGVLGLPDPETEINYDEPATIKKITIKGIKGEPYCVINSNIAAAQILSAYLSYPEYDNGDVVFGIAADYIKSLKIKDAEGTVSFKNLDKPSDFNEIGDAQIRLY